MTKYKLIKKYPGSVELGTIVERDSNCSNYYYRLINGVSNTFTPRNIENNPEFWELVVKKDYEILSYWNPEHGDTLIFRKNHPKSTDIHWYSQQDSNLLISIHCTRYDKIHSVKRLSDGEIFTIGDKCEEYGIIKYFKIENKTKLLVVYYEDCEDILKFVKHLKQPLFTTEDGVDIFKNIDKYYTPIYIVDKALNIKYCEKDFSVKPSENVKYFSTKEKAEEYILMNKPCLSLNDIEKSRNLLDDIDMQKLKSLVKSKI